MAMKISRLEDLCSGFLTNNRKDVAHDKDHIRRVVKNAKIILEQEQADHETVIAAGWLHDCVVLPKDHPKRSNSSTLAAKKAVQFLSEIGFSESKTEQIAHAIKAHSYSANITPETVEAKIVQDADRLDALGAIGIARCFAVSGQLGRLFYQSDDPFCEHRQPDDSLWTVDHFYSKLFQLPDTMNTTFAKQEAEKRVEFMKQFLERLQSEI